MIKVNIENKVNGMAFGGQFDSQELADAWKNKQIAKCSWGRPERDQIHALDDESVEAGWDSNEPVVIQEAILPVLDEDGLEVEAGIEEQLGMKYHYPCEYVITEVDLSLDPAYIKQCILEERRKEYPSLEECVHAILDGELDALQLKRLAVKTKHPLPKE